MDKDWSWNIGSMNPLPDTWNTVVFRFYHEPIVTYEMALQHFFHFIFTLAKFCKMNDYNNGFEFDLVITGVHKESKEIKMYKSYGNDKTIVTPYGKNLVETFYREHINNSLDNIHLQFTFRILPV